MLKSFTMSTEITRIITRNLGIRDYLPTWDAMKNFTLERQETTPDEIWVLQHHPVYTQGQSGKPEHVLQPGSIPVVVTDRGGQVTYHGPGQLVIYPLLDLTRLQLNSRQLVTLLENAVIQLLESYQIKAEARADAPGIYVDGAKICSIGLRIKKGRSYHGLALNIDMDLEPFSRINPCGYQGLRMCQISDFVRTISWEEIEVQMEQYLISLIRGE